MSGREDEGDRLRANGYHVMRQGTWANHIRELAVLRNENKWLREEKDHHEKWLAGILDESRRLQDRFNRITAALAVSGVEWSVIADLLGDKPSIVPDACHHCGKPPEADGDHTCPCPFSDSECLEHTLNPHPAFRVTPPADPEADQ